MRITWDEFYDGENGTRPLHLEVDEPYRSFDIYVYMTPVVGENTYMSAQPITLDEDGKADYLVPGDVLDGVGYFQAQIVAIGPNEKIVKSDTETIPTGESVPDKSAVLPTGEVITLVDVKAELDSLTASSIPYTDTEEIGVDNVQDAIDYALAHGGGGSIPTYTLRWANNEGEYKTYNVREVEKFIGKTVGSYELYLQMGVTDTRIEVYEIRGDSPLTMYFRGSWNGEQEKIYRIICGTTAESYEQTSYVLPDSTFDASSLAAPSMFGTAEYIDERIGTTGNLDPDSYASADDVEAIESKIPSAASAQNQLADKDFVNSSVATNTAYFIGTFDSVAELEAYSGTLTNNDYAFVVKYNPTVPTEVDAYDRYKYNASTEEWIFEYELNNSSFTSAQWAAINSAITANLVTQYSAHVANTVIHVTATDKIEWSDKYDKPANGIPKSDLAATVQTSLGKADTALQSVPAGYATETNVDTAIATAIGDAIGGSY